MTLGVTKRRSAWKALEGELKVVSVTKGCDIAQVVDATLRRYYEETLTDDKIAEGDAHAMRVGA
jgi:hypothetical protein